MTVNTDCGECGYNNTNCYLRYYNDVVEFGGTEWTCPECGQIYITHDVDFTCVNCGFTYECL